jgi:putative Mg2+ transporter-C (MgtC) family protein
MFPEIIIQLGFAVLLGALIGFEREYRSKAAGFRTITLITLGSTLFTVLSAKFGDPGSSRIASNIVMGIGFIGAGVIFKGDYTISGLTTAASIWVSAAIGMAIGLSEYLIASITVGFSLVILALFEKVQDWIDHFHQVRTYHVIYPLDYSRPKADIEEKASKLKLKLKIKKCLRAEDGVSFFYIITGRDRRLDEFSHFLISTREIKSFDDNPF